jgi:general secretion pathway protein N
MHSWKRLLAVGIITLVAGLIVMLPARVVHNWLSPPTLQMAGISGTVWNGRASSLLVEGLYLGNVRWQFRPLRLLTGKLAYQLQADLPGGFVESQLAAGLTGRVYIDTLNAALPISAVRGLLNNDDISGDISLQLDTLELVDGLPVKALGRGGVSNLVVRALAPGAIGNFSIEFQNTDNGVTGIVEDISGMLDVAATLQVNADRSYSLVGQVGATANATPGIEQQLRFLGSPDSRGLREFRLEGAL